METCKKCKKRFTVTSWTRNGFWRGVCPPCIIELCEKALSKSAKADRAWTGRSE